MTKREMFASERDNFYGKHGDPFLVRCPACHRENWSMAVAGGTCAWCGWKAPRQARRCQKKRPNLLTKGRARETKTRQD